MAYLPTQIYSGGVSMKHSLLVLLFACGAAAGPAQADEPAKLVALGAEDPKGDACGTSPYFRVREGKKGKELVYHEQGKDPVVIPVGTIVKMVLKDKDESPVPMIAHKILANMTREQGTMSTITFSADDKAAAVCLPEVYTDDQRAPGK